MNAGRIFFIALMVLLFAGWFRFLESGLSLVNLGTYLLVLILTLLLLIILLIIGIHQLRD